MLTKETMDKFLDWMKQNSSEECKDKLSYGVRAGVNSSGCFMQGVTIYHSIEQGNFTLFRDHNFFDALKELFEKEKLDYYIITTGSFYSEVYVYDPANSGFFELRGDPYAVKDDEYTFTSDVNLEEATGRTSWQTKYGNLIYMTESTHNFTEVAR